tara:strand:+ start:3293 stop:4282 length:990 start_codon:yes stop_codon:yes gene_type:complete
MKKKNILITGGTGYIGSCLFVFLKKKFNVHIVDKAKKKKWQKISKKNFHKCDILNFKKIDKIIKYVQPITIIHLASLSTVNEKIKKKDYFLNNVVATKNLIKVMKKNGIKNIIYSSTAAVYQKKNLRITENSKLKPVSKYGQTKLKSEELIKKSKLNFIIFRFFNVTSAITQPMTGEFHNPETHLVPTLINNLFKNKVSEIFGKDYLTKDGTCIRDYIHIKDICRAIHRGIIFFKKKQIRSIINLGNGNGNSNLDVIKKISSVTNKTLKFKFRKKRKGDQPILVCNINKSKKVLKWTPKYSSLKKMIKDEIIWSNFLKNNNFRRNFLKE